MNDEIVRYEREVVEFHKALEQWLGGRVSRDSGAFRRIVQSFAPECVLISPHGKVEPAATLCRRLGDAYGTAPDTSIWISDFTPEQRHAPFVLVRYVEWREDAGGTTGRLSSVLFVDEPATPSGMLWRYIHETWLMGHGPAETRVQT